MSRFEELFEWLGNQGCLEDISETREPHEEELRPEQILKLDVSTFERVISEGNSEKDFAMDMTPDIIDDFLSNQATELTIPSNFEIIAWYQPIHYYGEAWGIYYREEWLIKIAKNIFTNIPISAKAVDIRVQIYECVKSAMYILRLHEIYHHQVESFAIRKHIVTGNCSYKLYKKDVFSDTRQSTPHLCREEALCHANCYRKLNSTLNGKVSKEVMAAAKITATELIRSGVGPYAGAEYLFTDTDFTFAQSFLQSQIDEGLVHPSGDTDRWRNENKMFSPLFSTVPQYIVPQSRQQIFPPGVMQLTAPRRGVIKLLGEQGYLEVEGGKGSHTKYERPGSPMVIIPKGKELSQTVLSSTAKSLGMKLHDFAKMARDVA